MPNYNKKYPLIAVVVCLFNLSAKAQIITASTVNSIRLVDLATCASTYVCDAPVFNDMCVAPNGLIYGINNLSILSLDPSNGATTVIANLGAIATSLEYGIDGFLYAMGNAVRKIDPTNGNVQLMGNLPAGWNGVGDLVYLNGIYYGTVNTPTGQKLANINVTNPAASTIISNCPINGLVAGGSVGHPTCPRLYWFGLTPVPCWQYNVNAGTWELACSSLLPFGFGGADTPNNYTFPFFCACTTNAGNVSAQNFAFCGTTQTASVPFTGGEVLDSSDLLRYILFEDLNDPEGSILLQSAVPNFNFNPTTMTIGQTYYLGTVAGNALNGLVDLADTCIDFSDSFALVNWQPLPAVTFSVADPNVCAGDCTAVTATFTGAPPFTLTYTSQTTGSVTQTFAGNTGTFQLCTLPGSPPGSLVLQATALTDALCTCGQ